MGAGRYAPSPSGDLHFGNLRTALLAWLWARSTGRRFLLRIEDIDTQRSSAEAAGRQQADLQSLGITWDASMQQSQRSAAYEAALQQLPHYECYCSRREIQEASRAPHVLPGAYPGTCRNLSAAQRQQRRAELAAQNRVPALRLRSSVSQWQVHDYYAGTYSGLVDDMILRRGGQQPDWAYNLAVVVDDHAQGIDQIVRGDDLLSSAPRQAYLAHLLGYEPAEYIHVPLVLNQEGKRLAKRDGAVTLEQMRRNHTLAAIFAALVRSIMPAIPGPASAYQNAEQLIKVFDPAQLPREPAIFTGLDGGDPQP